MPFVDGFLIAVPTARKADYLAHAQSVLPLFRRLGALQMVETWGADVPDGVLTSFPMAVKLKADETVVFSWVVWPDRATRDRAWAEMETAPEMSSEADVPFDGKRMIFGGFELLLQANLC